jgi:hypothetical protein
MTSYTNSRWRTKGFLAGLFLMCLPNLLPAQDTLWLVNGEMIRCRVKTINRVDVDYIPWGQAGPLYSINKSYLLKLVYETGSNVVFQEAPAPVSDAAVAAADSTAASMGSDALIQKAMNDAQQHYDYTRPRNASIVIGLTAPVFYLIPGVIATAAMASTTPRYDYLNVPNEALYRSSPDYRQAYTRQARKIKSRKVWGGFLTGAGTTVAGIVALGILLF